MINATGIGTASWVEIAFILIALTGIVRTTQGFFRWRREDRARQRLHLNGRLRILYRGKMRLYALCLIKMAIYFTLAAQAALLPSYATDERMMVAWQRALAHSTHLSSPILLSISAVLLVLIPVFEERDRRAMDAADHAAMQADVARALDE